MAVLLEQIGAELSVIKAEALHPEWNKTLHFCRNEMISSENDYQPTEDDNLLHDVLLKGLLRGVCPFTTYFAEQWIVALYGDSVGLREDEQIGRGSITYSHDGELLKWYNEFTDVIAPWCGKLDDVTFDPKHPENERELFDRLIKKFGPRIAHCVTPQAELSKILPPTEANDFLGQRVDFLLSFPNGRCLVLEPGDHDTDVQIDLDRRRDEAFRRYGIETLRPRNKDIYTGKLYDEIKQRLEQYKVDQFLKDGEVRDPRTRAIEHLFLVPSLLVRLERLFVHFFLRQGLIHRPELRIGIIERDLECAEIGFASFVDRLLRLSRLYGIKCTIPQIWLYVQRDARVTIGDVQQLEMPVTVRDSLEGINLDLLIDVGIKCNILTKPVDKGAPHIGSVRQTFPHKLPVCFGYQTQVRPISLNDETDKVLESFVQDFFRKRSLRPGQSPILRNVLLQRATIGLLPTSAGKSLCYQLASLLTPGTTIVIDPIVALIQDQVQSLKEQFGIDRVLAWHAGAGLHDQDIGALLSEHIMVFISPERLQRPQFRKAILELPATDTFINYAVIDEAHCVSMWGHDFRPSYLTLERNIREYCTFQGHTPVIVALTGTASQLVLIDLKRELNIQSMEAIIRPDTFDRPELNFNLVKCHSTDGQKMLDRVMTAIARKLNVQDLATEAYGIIFAYTPKEVWKLFGQQVGKATECVRTVLHGDNHIVRYGIYTGSAPKENEQSLFSENEWSRYKERTLAAFKRGKINMLFGNTAVSVGIDNERLNYIINYEMPQSMEAYYQQCGRAGRLGQRSECYLIFSDDAPAQTQRWLNREIQEMPKRWDDIGTVVYFHRSNFPGRDIDVQSALIVFKRLFGKADEKGLISVPMFPSTDQNGTNQIHRDKDRRLNTEAKEFAERTERYISYWLILGILVDYEVTGMGRNTVYLVKRHPVVEKFLQDHDEALLTAHIVDSLHRYLSRYRPISRVDVEQRLASRPEGNLSAKSISFLMDFIYNQIEYQRRESIRTMVSYCNEADTSPERLRARVRAYFDSSEKFSEGLIKMADTTPDFSAVAAILDRVEGFQDAEHLYWETRRLLDERFRPDWAAVNLFAIAYRERAIFSDTFMRMLDETVAGLIQEPQTQNRAISRFLGSFLSYLSRLDQIFGEPLSGSLLGLCMGRLYEHHKLAYIGLIDEVNVVDEVREQMRLQVINLQLKEIIDANYSRITQ